ncbi:hypothetical protein Gotri_013943, partial [Gossypium trilobum]|nr:hypothetical protein [Gossypium trilobum]
MSSAAVGTFSASKQIGFNKNETKAGEEEELRDEKNKKFIDDNDEEAINNGGEPHDDQHDEEEEDDDDDAKLKSEKELDLGPQVSLKEQLEKDKDDESLRRWKEQLLGSVDMSAVGVDNTKLMLGTFSPQKEPYTFELEEETTPSGLFARGSYAVRTK